jgi:hypothetical protein
MFPATGKYIGLQSGNFFSATKVFPNPEIRDSIR